MWEIYNNNTILFKGVLPPSEEETTYSKERSEYEKLCSFLLKQNNAIINIPLPENSNRLIMEPKALLPQHRGLRFFRQLAMGRQCQYKFCSKRVQGDHDTILSRFNVHLGHSDGHNIDLLSKNGPFLLTLKTLCLADLPSVGGGIILKRVVYFEKGPF